jgi:hypothetical protein
VVIKNTCAQNGRSNQKFIMSANDKYGFIKSLDWKRFFNEDELAIAERFGIDGLLWMIEHFKGMPVYFTEARIDEMKKEYIQKNPDKLTKKELARKMEYSLMTIYRYNNTPDDPGLFDG